MKSNNNLEGGSKPVIVGVLVIVLLVIGFLVYKFVLSDKDDQGASVNQENQMDEADSKSMKDLLGLGSSQKCTYNLSQDKVQSSGVVYLSNGKMNSQYESGLVGSTMVKGYMIYDGQYNYIWSDGSSDGFKMKIEEVNSAQSSQGSGSQAQALDFNQKMDFDCESWNADSKMFEPPKNITFRDFSEMMKQVPSMPNSNKTGVSPNSDPGTADCSVCNSIPDDASKKACLVALNCQ